MSEVAYARNSLAGQSFRSFCSVLARLAAGSEDRVKDEVDELRRVR